MRTFSTSLLALAAMLSGAHGERAARASQTHGGAAAAQPPRPTASAATPPPARPAPPQKAVLPRILSDAMVKVARDLYLQGAEAMAQGRTADARAAFSAALGLNPHYSIYCNLGDADLRLGRPTNAAEEFAECVPGLEKDAKVSDAERAAVKKLFADAKAKVVEVVTHSGRAAGMPQVTTSIDTDRSSNNDDVTAYLEPGKHVVRFEAEGYESIAVDFDGAAGTRKEITPAWKKKAGPVVPMPTASATAEVPPAGPRKEIVDRRCSARWSWIARWHRDWNCRRCGIQRRHQTARCPPGGTWSVFERTAQGRMQHTGSKAS